MEDFIEQLEVLRRIFDRLPTELVPSAIDHMDHAAEVMANSVVYVPESMDCLVNTGQNVVQDFLHLEAHEPSFLPGPSNPPQNNQFFDFPADEAEKSKSPRQELYCFTCGEAFNNRKSLYRHGKTKNHKTRRLKYNRESKNDKNAKSFDPTVKPEDLIPIEDFSQISNILEEEADEIIANFSECGQKLNLTCLECGEIFKNRKALYRHGNRTNHILRLRKAEKSKGGPVKCEKCKYCTANEANLRRHMQRSHQMNGST